MDKMLGRRRTCKLHLSFLLCLLVSSPLYADFKVMGGMNFSKYGVSPEKEGIQWDYKFGFVGGIGFERNLSHLMLLELDVLYFQKGSSLESSDIENSEAKYKLNVLSLPILLRSKFLYDSSPYIVGGVEFSSILSHEVLHKEQEPVDLKANTRNIDFAFVFGCGYEIKIEDHLYFFIEGRYHIGTRNIVAYPLEGETKKTRAILILIGFRS